MAEGTTSSIRTSARSPWSASEGEVEAFRRRPAHRGGAVLDGAHDAEVTISQIAVTMDVYSQVTSGSTLRALKALGERLEGH